MKLPNILFGMPDIPMSWWNTICPYLEDLGFDPLTSTTCTYVYTAKNGVIIIYTVYVDDLLLLGGDIVLVQMLKKKLMTRFKMTDKGNVSPTLGMQVTSYRERGKLTIS